MDRSRFIMITGALVIVGIYSYKVKRNTDGVSKGAIIKFIIGGLLLPIHPTMRESGYSSLWFHIIATVSQYYSVLFAHLGTLQMRKNKVYINILKDKTFWFTNIMSLIISIIIIKEKGILPSFSDNEPHTNTHLYYIFYILNYFTIFMICISSMINFTVKSYSSREIKRFIWWHFGPFCLIFLTAGSAIMVINVFISYLWNDKYKIILNAVYDVNKTLFGITLLFFVILPFIPARIVSGIFHPVESLFINRIKKENKLLKLLHKKITPIVPGVKLKHGPRQRDDLLTEIADTWLIIWSHKNHEDYPSPKDKAKLILRMTKRREVLRDFGPLNPPEISDEVRYNLRIAKYLLGAN